MTDEIKSSQVSHDSYTVMLTAILSQLTDELIRQIKIKYDMDVLNNQTLNSSLKQILEKFFERKDIQPIDIFTIFSSLKKMEIILFPHDSKNFKFCFSDETLLTVGKSEITITVESSMITQYLKRIFEKLDTSHQNIVYMLYHDALKEISSTYFGLSKENLSITNLRHILYWMNLVTEKKSEIDMCKWIMREIALRKNFSEKWQSKSANDEISFRSINYENSLHKFIRSHFVQLSPNFHGENADPNFRSFYKYFIYVKG